MDGFQAHGVGVQARVGERLVGNLCWSPAATGSDDPKATHMSQLQSAAPARPVALGPDEGERIWFTGGAFTFKATSESIGGELFVMDAVMPAGFGPPLDVNEHVRHCAHLPRDRRHAGPGAGARAGCRATWNEFVGPPLGGS